MWWLGFALWACNNGPSQICVVRHAEAWKNVEPRPDDRDPDTLTPDGESQARALAPQLPKGVALTWASPTQRAQQTAALLGTGAVDVAAELRPLDGVLDWESRLGHWSRGEDPRPPGGESLADGQRRAQRLLTGIRKQLEPGAHAVVVTHADLASVILGELRGTPLLERPTKDTLATGEHACLPLEATE
jgi:broad specificity phosphatase PhoE